MFKADIFQIYGGTAVFQAELNMYKHHVEVINVRFMYLVLMIFFWFVNH